MERNIATPAVLLRTFAGLLLLLGLTVGASYLPLGRSGIAVALGIAGAKALLILLYFMQARYKSGLIRLFVATGFFWLGTLFALTLGDYLTRGAAAVPGK